MRGQKGGGGGGVCVRFYEENKAHLLFTKIIDSHLRFTKIIRKYIGIYLGFHL